MHRTHYVGVGVEGGVWVGEMNALFPHEYQRGAREWEEMSPQMDSDTDIQLDTGVGGWASSWQCFPPPSDVLTGQKPS